MENSIALGVLILLALSSVSMMIYYWYFNGQIRQLGQLGPQAPQVAGSKEWDVLHGAIKASEDIVGQAEIEGAKVIAQSRLRSDRLEEKAEVEIDEVSRSVQKQLLAESAKATEEFKKYLKTLQEESVKGSSDLEKITKERLEEMLTSLGKSMSEKLAEIESKSITLAEAEVAAMKKAVEEYRSKRMAAIDEDSVAIFNRAIALILKDSPVNAQAEIIKKAIEQAKAERFIQ